MNILVYCAIGFYLSLRQNLTEQKFGAYDHRNYGKPRTWFNIIVKGVPFLFSHDS